MSTSLQLIPAYLDSKPVDWRRDYVKNMRSIRGYPTYWRIRDDEAYIDGPPTLGAFYTRDPYTWQARIVKDSAGNNTDTIELYSLSEDITGEISNPNGDTEYRYTYSPVAPVVSYQHTAPVDSISLEFDQSGRRLFAFEAGGDVNFAWYDPVTAADTLSNFGPGYTPHVVTDGYWRTIVAIESERLVFYVKASTQQIVYRRQLDRYEIEYSLPNAPAPVVEILRVSKNLYGGITVLYCYEQAGELVTGSFTASDGLDRHNVGTDNTLTAAAEFVGMSARMPLFEVKIAAVRPTVDTELCTMDAVPDSAQITDFLLLVKKVFLDAADSGTFAGVPTSGAVTDFKLVSVKVEVDVGSDGAVFSPIETTGSVTDFVRKVSVIYITATPEQIVFTPVSSSGAISSFTLG